MTGKKKPTNTQTINYCIKSYWIGWVAGSAIFTIFFRVVEFRWKVISGWNIEKKRDFFFHLENRCRIFIF